MTAEERFEQWWKAIGLSPGRLWKDVLKEAWEAGRRDAQENP